MKYLGLSLLAVWLVVQGIIDLTNLHTPYQKVILASIALFSGVILLLNTIKTKFNNVGLLILAIWLVIRSSQSLFHFSFPYSSMIIAILGMISGVLLLLRV